MSGGEDPPPPPRGSAWLSFDGASLRAGHAGAGRALIADARCLAGTPVRGAYVHVCALADPLAALRFDEPEVQQVRRDALAWWLDRLGDALVCVTMLAVDGSRCAGALTATRAPAPWREDPFARLFAGTLVRSDELCVVPPPAGPVVERYAGVPWPGGRFA